MATGRIPGTSGSPLTAKGDIFAFSTTASRLPVGSDGQTLVANSANATGLGWQAPVQQNPVLNSAFQVWQRGTSIGSINATATYTADRWQAVSGATTTVTVSRQATADTTNLPSIQYCSRVQRNSGQTGTSLPYLSQSFETINSIPFAGKTVTFSFYARAGANYSAASSLLYANVFSGTGTDQNIINGGFTGSTAVIQQPVTLTTTWQRFTFSGSVASTATQLATYFVYTPVGTAGTNDYYEVTGVQLEVGSVATPFHTFSTTLQGELAACQRYYWRNSANATSVYASFGTGLTQSATAIICSFVNPVFMRTAASSIDFSGLYYNDGTNTASITAMTLNAGNSNSFITSTQATTTFGTQYRPVTIQPNNSSSAYIGFSAEL